VTDTIDAPGIWLDYANVNSRCTRNVVVNADCSNGGIFMEASQEPNLVDTNIVWNTRGSGIYQHDCDELTIAHNLVAYSTDAPVRMQICRGRKVLGRLSTAKRNKILNNVFVANGRGPAISDVENTCDYNVYAAGDGAPALGNHSRRPWDQHSLVLPIRASLDADALVLTWQIDQPLPAWPAVPRVLRDYFQQPREEEETLPGPILRLREAGKLAVDPIGRPSD
jgi:parallel beta-helix repeat protein